MSLQLRIFHSVPATRPLAAEALPRGWLDKSLNLLHLTFYQLTDPVFLGPILATQGTFGLGRCVLARLFSPVPFKAGALIGANLGAFALEGLVFEGSTRGIEKALGRKTEGRNFEKELGHAYLTMGMLRTFGGLARTGLQLSLGKVPVASLTWRDKFWARFLPQAADFGGIFSSHALASLWGLGEAIDFKGNLLQSGIATLHFGLASHLLHQIPLYTQLNGEIQRKTQEYVEMGARRFQEWSPEPILETGMGHLPMVQVKTSLLDFSKVYMRGTTHEGPPPSGPQVPPSVFNLEPQNEVVQTLHTFLSPKPSLRGRHSIPNLKEERVLELEAIFERGGHIGNINGGPILFDQPSGAMTVLGYFDVTRADITFYWLWKNHFGFPEAVEKQSARFWEKNKDAAKHWSKFQKALDTWGKIQQKAGSLGVKISQALNHEREILKFGGQLRLIHQLLELLPDSLLKTQKLQAIQFLSERQGGAKLSAFQNSELFIYDGTFRGSRRNLAGMFLQGLGHATGDRYLLGDHGDADISPLVRQEMHQAYDLISKHHALLGLDHAGGAEYRKSRQKINFDNFIAELHLMYVAAGPLLRHHVASFPKDSPVGTAWNFVYGELRDRIFAGREYDYSSSFQTHSETTPLELETHLTNPTTQELPRDIQFYGARGYLFQPPEEGTELILGRKHFPHSPGAKNISNKHLKLFRFEDFYFVQDLGSTHGTTVVQADGTKVELADFQHKPTAPYPILRGDRILLPGVELMIDLHRLD